MSTMDKLAPARTVRTYGKQARNQGYGNLARTNLDTNKNLGKPSPFPLSRREESMENGKEGGKGTGALKAAGKAGLSTVAHTPKPKQQADIFDVQSSDDEDRQSRSRRGLKRRKLNTPKTAPKDTEPRKRTMLDPVSTRDRKVAVSPAKDVEKHTEVEVVIRSPAKMKHEPSTQSSKTGIATLPTRPTSPRDVETTLNKRPTHGNLRRDLPVRKREVHTPPRKVPRLTKSFSTGTDRWKYVADRERDEPAKRVPSTAERRRLVDALGRKDNVDVPSDSSGDEGPTTFQISRSSSQPPDQDHTAGAMSLENSASVHPRRRKNVNPATQSGLKITYSRQRSFLNELDAIEEIGNDGLTGPGFPGSPSKADKFSGGPALPPMGLQSQTSGLAAADLEEEAVSGSGTVRSIHELRRSGDNARYHALIESIFEDMEDNNATMSRKRSGMVQLCTKLLDSQFSQRFLSNALEKRFAKIKLGAADLICGYLTACIYALLLSSGSTSPMTLQHCWVQILKVAPSLLREDKSILEIVKRRELNMTKAGRADIQDFSGKITESKIWTNRGPSRTTPQLLALRCLELGVRKLRETGNSMETMPVPILRQVVHILLNHSLAKDFDKSGQEDLVLETTLSILESYTIHTSSLEEEQQESLKPLSRLGPLLSHLGRQQDAHCKQIEILEIRLILNITNNNSALCEEFSSSEFIEALAQIVITNFESVGDENAGPQKGTLLDTVILALGALINLTEWSGTSRRVLLESRIGSTTLLDRLVPLFVDGLEAIAKADSVVQTHSNVAFGYLSVLLCTACLDGDARSHLREKLQARTFGRLLSTVEEFLHYHRKVEDELHEDAHEGEAEDAMTGFTSRLQGIVDRIRAAERG